MDDKSQTWHYGLMAQYWSEHETDGPELAYFQNLIEGNGEPVLDAGCGTGRLLIPYLRAGLDVDGCDVSGDMLSHCQEKAEQESFNPKLYHQALHELDLPRKYQTIIACGVLGIGGSRQQDFLALKNFYKHLKPGGLLLINNYLPYGDSKEWGYWLKEMRNQLPESWPALMGKTPPEDGSNYEMYARVVAFDPLNQRFTRQIRIGLWQDGQLTTEEEYILTENVYFRNELHQMLERVGFEIEAIQGNHTEVEATSEHDVIVFIARKQL